MRDDHTERLRLLRFERALARARWFGVALGLYQVLAYKPYAGTTVPDSAAPIALSGLALMGSMNLVATLLLRRDYDARALRRLGFTVFLGDMASMWTIVWAFNFEQFGATWVILSLLALEGALRYKLIGAFAPALIAIPVEVAREFARNDAFGFPIFIDSLTFRIGFIALIGAIGGGMARNLDRERHEAERHADEAERSAMRERTARRESVAFQQVILAGVSANGIGEALRRMLRHVAQELGYTRSVVLLIEEDGRLHPVTAHGFAAQILERSIDVGQGIAGTVGQTGKAEIVPDVSKDPRYLEIDPSTRSSISVPIRVNGRVIGVLEVESPDVAAFTSEDASRLERLSDQMALVISNARLLSQERALVDRLRELDVMKTDFIAIASHELRTPLTAIQGTVKTLQRPGVTFSTEQIWDFIGIMDRQADRLTRLVEDLLLVSRIDHGSVSLRMEETSLDAVMQDALEEIGQRAHRVSLAISPAMPPIRTDGHRVCQIARNLIENALKFSDDDTSVRVSVHENRDMFLIEVADEGVGIPAEELQHIFQRFHQVGGSMRRRSDGFGLGLYITKRLTEALGGTIDIRSTVGEGSTFRVYLPLVRLEEEQIGATA